MTPGTKGFRRFIFVFSVNKFNTPRTRKSSFQTEEQVRKFNWLCRNTENWWHWGGILPVCCVCSTWCNKLNNTVWKYSSAVHAAFECFILIVKIMEFTNKQKRGYISYSTFDNRKVNKYYSKINQQEYSDILLITRFKLLFYLANFFLDMQI